MRAIRKYKNGGGWPPDSPPPTGFDPQWMAEQLKFAQLLRDEAEEEKIYQQRQGNQRPTVKPAPEYTNPDPFPTIQKTMSSPELREQRGRMNPLFQAANFITPVGDVMAGLTGVGQMISGDFGAGATNLGLAAASALVPGPGPIPKVKPRVRPTKAAEEMIGGMKVTRRPPSEVLVGEHLSEASAGSAQGRSAKYPLVSLNRRPSFDGGTPHYEPFIGGAKQRQGLGIPDGEFVKATMNVLDDLPVGSYLGGASVSTNSMPLMYSKYQKGQFSAGKYPEGWGGQGEGNFGPLNDMGKPYKNSDEVTQWHDKRSEQDGMQQGPMEHYDPEDGSTYFEGEYDNRFSPQNQMSKEEFLSIDPKAKEAAKGGNTKLADKLYDRYRIQADNDFGISSFGAEDSKAMLNELEAQELADIFNANLRQVEAKRVGHVERAQAKGETIAPSEGIPNARVAEWPDEGGFYVEYPLIPFKRNFEKGGRIKVNKRRQPGMRLLR